VTTRPKPRKRVIDRTASRAKRDEDRWCRSHRAWGDFVIATNCHHVLGKAQGGDDVVDNLIPICGSGSAGCHGALHGNPFVSEGMRRNSTDVRFAIGRRIRYPEVMYLVERMGEDAALEHLRDFYFVQVYFNPFMVVS
jgi:hypothetical protein